MIGLRRGTVKLSEHQAEWGDDARDVIILLKSVFASVAADIQHVGSTSVPGLKAKPIIDIVVGVREFDDVWPLEDQLKKYGIRYAGQDVKDQILFVMGDFANDTRTHHIHVVILNESAWKNYIRFRDYLKAFRAKAAEYEAAKEELAAMYPDDRNAYTQGKAPIIERMLQEANRWADGHV